MKKTTFHNEPLLLNSELLFTSSSKTVPLWLPTSEQPSFCQSCCCGGPLAVCSSTTRCPLSMAGWLHLRDSVARRTGGVKDSQLWSLSSDLHNSSKQPLSRNKPGSARRERVVGSAEEARSHAVCLRSALLTEALTPSFRHNGASHPFASLAEATLLPDLLIETSIIVYIIIFSFVNIP